MLLAAAGDRAEELAGQQAELLLRLDRLTAPLQACQPDTLLPKASTMGCFIMLHCYAGCKVRQTVCMCVCRDCAADCYEAYGRQCGRMCGGEKGTCTIFCWVVRPHQL